MTSFALAGARLLQEENRVQEQVDLFFWVLPQIANSAGAPRIFEALVQLASLRMDFAEQRRAVSLSYGEESPVHRSWAKRTLKGIALDEALAQAIEATRGGHYAKALEKLPSLAAYAELGIQGDHVGFRNIIEGSILTALGRYSEATALFEATSNLADEKLHAVLHAEKAMLHLMQNRPDQMQEDLERTDQKSKFFPVLRAALLVKRGAFNQADELLDESEGKLESAAGKAVALIVRSWIAKDRRETSRAKTLLAEAYQMCPELFWVGEQMQLEPE